MRGPCGGARSGWLLVATLVGGCRGDEAPATEAAPVPTDPAMPGKVAPLPASELALGRAVLDALTRDDWDGYTNGLVTRGDMMGLVRAEDRGDAREQRKKRRRLIWRHVNRLRQEEAEAGWKTVRREAAHAGIRWDAVRLVDVWSKSAVGGIFPDEIEASRLTLVLAHGEHEWEVELGVCARAQRGWVLTQGLKWGGIRRAKRREGKSLLGREPPPTPGSSGAEQR